MNLRATTYYLSLACESCLAICVRYIALKSSTRALRLYYTKEMDCGSVVLRLEVRSA